MGYIVSQTWFDLSAYPADSKSEGSVILAPTLQPTPADSASEGNIGCFVAIHFTLAAESGSEVLADIWRKPPASQFVLVSTPDTIAFPRGDGSGSSYRFPLLWTGDFYRAEVLGNQVIAYGQNSIIPLSRNGLIWGPGQPISKLGLFSKNAMVSTGTTHYWINQNGELWEYALGGTPKKLGYKSFLQSLSAGQLIMSFNEGMNLIYICDSTYGFIYTIGEGLGKGPANISSIVERNGRVWIAATTSIIPSPVFEMMSGPQDLGSRSLKYIYAVHTGLALSQPLLVALDYRIATSDKDNWKTTAWEKTDRAGIAYITCQCREFRIRAKMSSYESFTLPEMWVDAEITGRMAA